MTSSQVPDQEIPIRVLGGPTVLFEYGGLRFLTDPTFDQPGDHQRPGGPLLTKTAPPPAGPAEIGRIDVVLLSHDQHPDNLDESGRELLGRSPLTLTTTGAAGRLGGSAKGLAEWQPVALDRPGGGSVTVTGVPAIHGPGRPDQVEPVTGHVIGFVLSADGLPTMYVSGDNASLDAVREIAERCGPVGTAVLFAGAVSFPALFDGGLIVFDSEGAAEAARILGASRVVPAHCEGWSHYSEGREALAAAFSAAGLADRLDFGDGEALSPGA
ncbi:MAG: MBL fold metallo-hydrolase [Actinobacteria bacterium]|nr:MBL fold metallo-hydrolase [Actinomycetota bacterium]